MRKTSFLLPGLLVVIACGGDNGVSDGGGGDGSAPDGSVMDTGPGSDTGTPDDSGSPDSGSPDTGMMTDGSSSDGSSSDGSSSDGSVADGGVADGAADGGGGDAGCDVVQSPWHYVVDPVNGSDANSSTGSGTNGGNAAPACAFKTITHAITALLAANNPPLAGTQIIVKGASTVSVNANGETFPINVPKNVLVTSTGGVVSVVVTSGDAFKLAATGSGLDGLTIDGSNNTGARAVVSGTGTDKSDKLSNLVIKSFSGDCVAVENTGALTVGDGVAISGCGTGNSRRSGIHASSSSLLIVNPATTPVVIKTNTEYGIKVEGSAQLVLTSTLGNTPPSSALVQLDGNALANLLVQQTPNPNNPPPICTVTGAAMVNAPGAANADGDGIKVFGGSTFKLRGSYVLKNLSNGVLVATYPQNVNGASDVSGIDLGASAQDYGKNTVQDATDSNGAAGICLNLSQALNQNLKALGNKFASNIDCSAAVSALTKGMCAANSKTHVGIAGSQMNSISTSMCTN